MLDFPHPAPSGKSFFAWSLNKAGSTLLTRMLEDYLASVNHPTLNIPGILFQNGLSSNIGAKEYKKILFAEGYAYVGWRNPAALKVKLFDFTQVKNILLVRDPRDRLVSSYFSIAHSHAIPKCGALKETMEASRKTAQHLGNVNDWINSEPKELHSFLMGMNGYHKNLPSASTRIYRYEDIIYRKEEFLADMIEYAGLPYDTGRIRDTATKHDIRPSNERPNHHVRQVKYGNFREHMNSESQNAVEKKYRICLEAYGYFDSEKFGEQLVYAKEGEDAHSVLSKDLLGK